MTLLRAMSELDPQDLEHALCAGNDAGQTAEAVLPEQRTGMFSVQTAGTELPAEKWRHTGKIAAAACLVLTAGMLLYFRSQDAGLVQGPSVSGQLEEITAAVTEETTAASEAAAVTGTSVRTETGKAFAVTTGTTAAQTGTTQPPETDQMQSIPQDVPPEQHTQPETAEAAHTDVTSVTQIHWPNNSEPQTAAPAQTDAPEELPVYASEIPVLAATGDGAGTLSGSLPAYDMQIITDPAAIRAYLSGSDPVITVGSGSKSAGTVDAIMQHPELLRIRWQPETSVWDSYGIQSAVLDGSGVLHLAVGMYNSGAPQPETGWIYETSLICEAGTMPPVQELELTLSYYADTTGITQWLAYTASLDEDVYVQYRP